MLKLPKLGFIANLIKGAKKAKEVAEWTNTMVDIASYAIDKIEATADRQGLLPVEETKSEDAE